MILIDKKSQETCQVLSKEDLDEIQIWHHRIKKKLWDMEQLLVQFIKDALWWRYWCLTEYRCHTWRKEFTMKIIPISPVAQINIHNVKIIGDTRPNRKLDISRRHYFSEELILIF